ncbi:MAG: hypothetical protein DSZ05_08675 [Sulfurospirillum sp.]|nr:MAG: hypothetical protein DSZ05_08675 [Sulfurospirillum sp.]
MQEQIPTLEQLEESAETDFSEDFDLSEQRSSSLEQTNIYSADTPPIPENMTFDKFESILLEINPYYPKSAITLNLPLSSVIRTEAEKAAFREKMQHDFHLPESKIDQLMKQHKLIWDWINLLR